MKGGFFYMTNIEGGMSHRPDHRVLRWRNNTQTSKGGSEPGNVWHAQHHTATPSFQPEDNPAGEPVIGVGSFHEPSLSQEDPYSKEHVATLRWGVRRIQSADIALIQEWFKDPDVPKHIFHDDINPNIPKHWYNKSIADKFSRSLEKFYFPEGSFPIRTKIPREDGKPQPKDKTISVDRHTNVAILNGRVLGVQSWLTDDPYAPEEDREAIERNELKVAYGHVMIVDPRFQHKGAALYMTAMRSDELLGTSSEDPGEYDQISTLIDLNGENWGKVIEFFTRFGYAIDRRSLEEIPQVNQEGEQIKMYRYLMTANDWWRARPRAVRTIEEKMGIEYDDKKV